MSLHDPKVVRAEYASEAGLVARASVYQGGAGLDARETAFRAVAEMKPAPDNATTLHAAYGRIDTTRQRWRRVKTRSPTWRDCWIIIAAA